MKLSDILLQIEEINKQIVELQNKKRKLAEELARYTLRIREMLIVRIDPEYGHLILERYDGKGFVNLLKDDIKKLFNWLKEIGYLEKD